MRIYNIYEDIMGHNWDQMINWRKLWWPQIVTPLERWELVQPDPCKTPLVCTDNIQALFFLNHCQHQADQWDISWYITHGAWQVEAITWWRKRWEPQSPWAGSWFSLSVKFWVVSGRCWMKMDKDVDKGYMFWTSTWFLGTPRIVSHVACFILLLSLGHRKYLICHGYIWPPQTMTRLTMWLFPLIWNKSQVCFSMFFHHLPHENCPKLGDYQTNWYIINKISSRWNIT